MKGKQKLLSEQLRAAIQASGLTAYRLAKEAGTMPDVITRFLNGDRGLRLATVDKLARVLQLELCEKEKP
jgi:transcriptional regulator with XRE-family HTH domain